MDVAVEPSYFPNVVNTFKDRLGNGYYSATQQRSSDFYILSKQNPIGWRFFSKANVNGLLVAARIDFADIVDDMIATYETMGQESQENRRRLPFLITQLNQTVLTRSRARQDRARFQTQRYSQYMTQPAAATYRTPMVDRPDKSLFIDRQNIID